MGLFDGISNLFDTAISGIFGGSTESYLGGSSPGYPSALSVNYPPYQVQNFPEQSYPMPQAYPVMSTMPAVMGGVARWAMSFPRLWQALQTLRANYRIPMTVEKLWALTKSAGPGVVTGLIGAEALQELFVYHSTHKCRRMNVANTKALRRSVRRLKGFDRLSHRVSAQLSRVGGSRRRPRTRCGTCRKSPCAC